MRTRRTSAAARLFLAFTVLLLLAAPACCGWVPRWGAGCVVAAALFALAAIGDELFEDTNLQRLRN